LKGGELEGYRANRVFLEFYVETELGTDEEAFSVRITPESARSTALRVAS
jgi:hypothetical protein